MLLMVMMMLVIVVMITTKITFSKLQHCQEILIYILWKQSLKHLCVPWWCLDNHDRVKISTIHLEETPTARTSSPGFKTTPLSSLGVVIKTFHEYELDLKIHIRSVICFVHKMSELLVLTISPHRISLAWIMINLRKEHCLCVSHDYWVFTRLQWDQKAKINNHSFSIVLVSFPYYLEKSCGVLLNRTEGY